MNWNAWLQYTFFLLVVTLLTKPVGQYMFRVFQGQRTLMDPLLRPIERLLLRVSRVDASEQMDWSRYAQAFILFGLISTLAFYTILRLQRFLPWFYPSYMTIPMTPDLAMNTAISFSTTTTWQAYGGETTMSYFSQMVGLVSQNFLAGASGLAVGIAFIRGLARQKTSELGNFWQDLVRSILWILLPISLIGALLLVAQGVPMNFHPYVDAAIVDASHQDAIGTDHPAIQHIAQGPVAALEIIKNLGTNGGGFFNVNGAHPYENPTPLSNFLEMLAIMLLPAALTYTFGLMVGNTRQGWTLYVVMMVLFAAGLSFCYWAEQSGNQSLAHRIGTSRLDQSSGNMEGKEVRFGVSQSVFTAVTTSNGATGSYNSMHDSFTPLGGMIPLINMLLGEIIFGGLGTGIYSIVLIALIGLFMAGLMVGRTPEYLGKKIGPPEAKMLTLYTLALPIAILPLAAIAVSTKPGLSGLTTNLGPHGLTEILFAFSSSFANNGQTFAGLSANSPFYNLTTAFAMMMGRFALAVPALALAGLFAQQIKRPESTGKVRTDTPTFAILVIASALIIAGLSFFPVLALGPILEHLLRF